MPRGGARLAGVAQSVFETLDGMPNHSCPAGAIDAEGEVVSWADRLAYVCHDWEDAAAAGIVSQTLLPARGEGALRRAPGTTARGLHRGARRHRAGTGRIGMDNDMAEALAAFRAATTSTLPPRRLSSPG